MMNVGSSIKWWVSRAFRRFGANDFDELTAVAQVLERALGSLSGDDTVIMLDLDHFELTDVGVVRDNTKQLKFTPGSTGFSD